MNASSPFKVGDFVQMFFDTGAMGAALLYGVVIAPTGEKRATILWESGLHNRVENSSKIGIQLARDKDAAKQAMDKITQSN